MLHQYNPKSIWYLDKTRMQGNSVFDRLTALYFRKRSEVETWEGGVIPQAHFPLVRPQAVRLHRLLFSQR